MNPSTKAGFATRAGPSVLALLLGAGLQAPVPAAAGATPPVIAPYFVQWGVYERNYHVTNIPAAKVTHVIYAFAEPVYDAASNTAALISYDPYADLERWYPGDTPEQPFRGNFHQLLRLKQRFPHLRTLISVGGWTLSDAFSDIAADPRARAAFVESCVAFVTRYGFDGVDLDWEFPVEGGEAGLTHRPEDADNLVRLVQELRTRLDERGAADGRTYLLTAATAADPDGLGVCYRLAAMAAHLDWFNVMTYNYAGGWSPRTGHNAPLYANPAAPGYSVHGTVQAYLAQGSRPCSLSSGFLSSATAFRTCRQTRTAGFKRIPG